MSTCGTFMGMIMIIKFYMKLVIIFEDRIASPFQHCPLQDGITILIHCNKTFDHESKSPLIGRVLTLYDNNSKGMVKNRHLRIFVLTLSLGLAMSN